MLNLLKGQDGVPLVLLLLLMLLLFAGGSAFGGYVLGIMIGLALFLGIGGLGKVVLGGTGAGGDERFGALYVPVTRAGDLAFGGNDGL